MGRVMGCRAWRGVTVLLLVVLVLGLESGPGTLCYEPPGRSRVPLMVESRSIYELSG